MNGFLTPPHLCPDSSAQPRLPSRWRCASTLRLRATSLPSKRSNSTTESSMRFRRATQLSPFNTGLPQDQSSRRSHKTAKNPDTMSFPSPRFPQNRCEHAFTPNRQCLIQSLSDYARQTPPTLPSQASLMSTSLAPTTPPVHSSPSNQTVNPTTALVTPMFT